MSTFLFRAHKSVERSIILQVSTCRWTYKHVKGIAKVAGIDVCWPGSRDNNIQSDRTKET